MVLYKVFSSLKLMSLSSLIISGMLALLSVKSVLDLAASVSSNDDILLAGVPKNHLANQKRKSFNNPEDEPVFPAEDDPSWPKIAFVTHASLGSTDALDAFILPSVETWLSNRHYYVVMSEKWKSTYDEFCSSREGGCQNVRPVWVECQDGGLLPLCCRVREGLLTMLRDDMKNNGNKTRRFDYVVYQEDNIYVYTPALLSILQYMDPSKPFLVGPLNSQDLPLGMQPKSTSHHHLLDDEDDPALSSSSSSSTALPSYTCSRNRLFVYPHGRPMLVYSRGALELLENGFESLSLDRQCREFRVGHHEGNGLLHWMYSLPFLKAIPIVMGDPLPHDRVTAAIVPSGLMHELHDLHIDQQRDYNKMMRLRRQKEGKKKKTFKIRPWTASNWHNVTGYRQTATYQKFGEPSTWGNTWNTMPTPDCRRKGEPTTLPPRVLYVTHISRIYSTETKKAARGANIAQGGDDSNSKPLTRQFKLVLSSLETWMQQDALYFVVLSKSHRDDVQEFCKNYNFNGPHSFEQKQHRRRLCRHLEFIMVDCPDERESPAKKKESLACKHQQAMLRMLATNYEFDYYVFHDAGHYIRTSHLTRFLDPLFSDEPFMVAGGVQDTSPIVGLIDPDEAEVCSAVRDTHPVIIYNRAALERMEDGIRANGLVKQCMEFKQSSYRECTSIFHWMYSIPKIRISLGNQVPFASPGNDKGLIMGVDGVSSDERLGWTMERIHSFFASNATDDEASPSFQYHWQNVTEFRNTISHARHGDPAHWKESWKTMPEEKCLVRSGPSPRIAFIVQAQNLEAFENFIFPSFKTWLGDGDGDGEDEDEEEDSDRQKQERIVINVLMSQELKDDYDTLCQRKMYSWRCRRISPIVVFCSKANNTECCMRQEGLYWAWEQRKEWDFVVYLSENTYVRIPILRTILKQLDPESGMIGTAVPPSLPIEWKNESLACLEDGNILMNDAPYIYSKGVVRELVSSRLDGLMRQCVRVGNHAGLNAFHWLHPLNSSMLLLPFRHSTRKIDGKTLGVYGISDKTKRAMTTMEPYHETFGSMTKESCLYQYSWWRRHHQEGNVQLYPKSTSVCSNLLSHPKSSTLKQDVVESTNVEFLENALREGIAKKIVEFETRLGIK